MKTRLLLAVLVLALVIGAGLAVQHKRAAVAAWPAAGVPPLVAQTRELASGPVSLTLPVTAEVQPVREAVLASRYSAYVVELDYFEADRFRQGEVLARLDMSQVEADLTRAEAQLAQSRLQENTLAAELAAAKSLVMSEEARVARLQALLKGKNATPEQVQAGEAALAAARARLASAQASTSTYRSLHQAAEAQAHAAREALRYGVITAPFDGVVSQRLAQPGDLAAAGKPLLKVMDPAAGNRLLVSVPQALRPVALIVRGERLPLTAWPEAVSEGMTRFEARGKLGLLPGARVDAGLEVYRAEGGVLVPRVCLLGDDGKRAQLLQVEGDQARTVSAEIAAQGEQGVALADRTLAGARVVCASPDILTRIQAGAPAHWMAPTRVPDEQPAPRPGTHEPVTLGGESAFRATARVF